MESTAENILRLQPTQTQVEGRKRRLTGYNIFLSRFFSQFEDLGDDEKKELLCKSSIHSLNDYIASDEDSVVTKPSTNNIDIIRLAAWQWRHTSAELKQAWKLKACEVNELPILGTFDAVPTVITNNVVMDMLTREHYRFISSMNNMLKSKPSVIDSVKRKTFGKEKVLLGSQIYKSYYLNYLLKLCFFDSNYSVFDEREIVHRYKNSMVVHIRSMSRIVKLFCKHGKSAFAFKNSGKEFTCAGKVIVKEKQGDKEGIGYIIDGDTILMETCNSINLNDVELPQYDSDEGLWATLCDDDIAPLYSVVQYDPIRIKIFDSGNFQMTINRVVLSAKSKIIPYY